MGTTVLHEHVSMPILIAPTSFQGLSHAEGEVATVKAAGAAKTLMILSTLSTFSIEQVMAVATGPVWFQLYVFKDRAISASLVKRAEVAGCKAIVFTVDVPLLGRRERDVRNRFKWADDVSVKSLLPAGLQEFPDGTAGSGLAPYIASLFDPALTWKDIEWLAGITHLPVVVKGILRSDDALLAVKHGASGVVVSNHGARQLDTTPATISVLPEMVDTVGGKVEVYVDGGIRRGTDVLKAIALRCARRLHRTPCLMRTGFRCRNRRKVCSGNGASGIRSGHGAFRLPNVELNYTRSHSAIVIWMALLVLLLSLYRYLQNTDC
jgi:4-hydroxymandelate oxidase